MRRRIARLGAAVATAFGSMSLGAQAPACVAPPPGSPARVVTVPADVHNNHIYLRACVAGQPLSLILDTGAPTSFLDLGVARRLGIGVGAAFTARGAGAGTVAGARLDRTTVALADAGIEHDVANAIDFSGVVPREGHRLDGVLGFDFVRRFLVRIDYAAGELRLIDPARFEHVGAGVILPATFVGNFPHVDVDLLLPGGDAVRARMMVDVGGAQGISLTRRFVDRHRLRSRVGPLLPQRGGSGVGGATTYDVARLAGVRLAGVTLQRPLAHLHSDSGGVFSDGGSWAGTIGGELLRRFVVYLDYPGRRLILEPAASTAEPFETDMSGLSLVMDAALTTMIVDGVTPGTPAAEAGVTAGDTVTAVDGRRADARVREQLRVRLRRAGERVTLSLRRDGVARTVTLLTRRSM